MVNTLIRSNLCYQLLFIFLLLLMDLAPAYSCLPTEWSIYRNFYPRSQEKNVAISTEVWIFYYIGKQSSTNLIEQVKLYHSSGREIESSVRIIPAADLSLNPTAGYYVILKPHDLLSSYSTYEVKTVFKEWPCRVVGPLEDCASSEYHVNSSFTTSDSINRKAPSFRGWDKLKLWPEDIWIPGASCGPFHYFPFSLTWHAAENIMSPNYLRYDIYSSEDLNTPILAILNKNNIVGAEDCMRNSVSTNYFIRENPKGYVIRVSDLSGNTSPFSEKLTIPKRCGLPQEPIEHPWQDGSFAPESNALDSLNDLFEKTITSDTSIHHEQDFIAPENTSLPFNCIGCQYTDSSAAISLPWLIFLFFYIYLIIRKIMNTNF